MKCQDTYKDEVKTMVLPYCTARVFFPILTEEERERRMNRLKKATIDFLLAVEKSEKNKKKE